jgi:hypothetical protein
MGETNVRKFEGKKTKFYGGDARKEDTIEIIDLKYVFRCTTSSFFVFSFPLLCLLFLPLSPSSSGLPVLPRFGTSLAPEQVCATNQMEANGANNNKLSGRNAN